MAQNGTVRVVAYVSPDTAARLDALARGSARSRSGMAGLLLERALAREVEGLSFELPQPIMSDAASQANAEMLAATVPPEVSARALEAAIEETAQRVAEEPMVPKGPLFARAGCLNRVPQGVQCQQCGGVHKP